MTDPVGALLMMAGAAMMRPVRASQTSGLAVQEMHAPLVKAYQLEPLDGFRPDLVRKLRVVK